MTTRDRLKRLAELESRLKIGRTSRLYVRLDDGSWLGDGPPGGELGPRDQVLEVVFVPGEEEDDAP